MLRLLLTTAAAAVLLAPAAEAASRPSCFKAQGRTLDAGRWARAYVSGTSVYACRRGERQRIRLATNHDDGYVTSGSVGQVAVAGRFAAFAFTATDVSCKAACPPEYEPTRTYLTVVDLRTRARQETRFGGEPFVLTATGAAAWIGDGDVLAFHRGALRSLDPGPVTAGSLEASRSRVTWLRDGVVHGAVLR